MYKKLPLEVQKLTSPEEIQFDLAQDALFPEKPTETDGKVPIHTHSARDHAPPHEQDKNWLDLKDLVEDTLSKGKSYDDDSKWRDYMDNSKLNEFRDAAYANEDKYSIRINPYTGKKEAYIAGTISAHDWWQNIAESGWLGDAVKQTSLMERHHRMNKLEAVFIEEGVEVVYGHSRGVAEMSDLDQSHFLFIGHDGATILGQHKEYVNIRAHQIPDFYLGFGHQGNVSVDNVEFHNVTETTDKQIKKAKTKAVGKPKVGKPSGKTTSKAKAARSITLKAEIADIRSELKEKSDDFKQTSKSKKELKRLKAELAKLRAQAVKENT